MSDGNGVDDLAASAKALSIVAARQGTTAAALHETILTVRPYAISMRWQPIMLVANLLLGTVNAVLLYAILLALLKR